MRIIAGKFRSRKLRSLPGMDIRPTSDRLRETLFSILLGGNPEALQRSVWLDLFAGTGAVGIEALSRGAAMVYFVESSKSAAELIRQNLMSLKISSGFEIVQHKNDRAIRDFEARQIKTDFIFLDPPYQSQQVYRDTLNILGSSPISEHALVIAEHEKRFDPGETFGRLQRFRKLEQGNAALSFYR
jgi:16S rRNA (guanine966-N2)-methyltransferase